MFVIVEIAGLQYKVEQNQQLYVNKLKGEAGDSVSFDRVLLSHNGSVSVGAPVIDGLAVAAKIVEHVKGDKVIVFKKKRRKGYKVKNGHRQQMTLIEIVSIGEGSQKSSKQESKAKEEKKSESKPAKVSDKKADDLTIVEGIGPKVKEIFNNEGILTFADLASKTAEELKNILTPHGGRYASMTPDTWPKQAQLAAEGKWEELKVWQDELNGGK